jgi:hypothetical protein
MNSCKFKNLISFSTEFLTCAEFQQVYLNVLGVCVEK